MTEIKLFSGNSNSALANRVCDQLGIPPGRAIVDRFSDNETMVEIQENVRGCDVFVLQSTCGPANEHIMELLIMADALRRASASRITAVIPYFGYARQDRRVLSARVPITAKVVADLLEVSGVSRLLTVDLHADQIQGFFNIPVDNIYGTPVLMEEIHKREFDYKNVVVVSPDVGGVLRARATAKRLNDAGMVIIDKRRVGPNKAEAIHIIGEVLNKDCIIVDDLIDTAGTLCSAAQKLKQHGAKTVSAYITHPVLSGPAISNIAQSDIDEVVVTDTIPLKNEASNCLKIRGVSLSKLLAQAISNIHKEVSLSALLNVDAAH